MTAEAFAHNPMLQTPWRRAREWKAKGVCHFTMTDGRRFYEVGVDPRHETAAETVLRSIECPPLLQCVALSSVHIAFDEWTLLCPDVAIWDKRLDEQETPITLRPQAVVEILHPKSLDKDLVFGVPLYLRVGTKDVLIVDPDAAQTYHFRPGEPERNYQSPHTLTLACGCQITV